MSLMVTEEGELGGNGLEAYFVGGPHVSAIAIERALPAACKRARQIEGYGYSIRPPRTGERAMFRARDAGDVDPVSVRAMRRCIRQLEPSWFECVKEVCREGYNGLREIAGECGLELHAAKAIIDELRARGELPA